MMDVKTQRTLARKWERLGPVRQSNRIMRALDDKTYFLTDEYFLNSKPRDAQSDIILDFYRRLAVYVLIMLCGRRAGKSWIGATFSCIEAFELIRHIDPAAYWDLDPGSKIMIINMGKSEEQAQDTVYDQTFNKIERSPYFQSFYPDMLTSEIRFETRAVEIKSLNSVSASGVGRTVKLLLCDELVKLIGKEASKESAWNVWAEMSISTSDFGFEGYRMALSTGKYTGDIMSHLVRQSKTIFIADDLKSYFPQYQPERLVSSQIAWVYPTWDMHTADSKYALEHPFMIEERIRDPERFWREYGCKPSAAEETYFSMPERIDLCFHANRPNVLQYINDTKQPPPEKMPPGLYGLALDPAQRVDSFGFALAKLNPQGIAEYHGLLQMKPTSGQELDPFWIKAFVKLVVNYVGVFYIIMDDVTAFPEMRRELELMGILVEINVVKKSHYDRLKEAIYTQRVAAPEYEIAQYELKNLNLIRGIKIDHPPKSTGGSKDVSDAMANVLYLLTEVMPTQGGNALLYAMTREGSARSDTSTFTVAPDNTRPRKFTPASPLIY